MPDIEISDLIENTGKLVDVIGVGVIVLGAFWSAVWTVVSAPRAGDDRYRSFRRRLGRSILLGLELLVAADIIRTVAVRPDFRSVGVLAVIVAVRTFLSFSLELEITGRWPWQQAPAENRRSD